ncbi:NifU N-terminal domain-containing protein [Leptospira sp. GIMC2001]|uniref:NifU N-terminal domain-containing protein n=1 Tax=Leptospira sp. GIMC2001 TaxID=1513297 RepID=UPI00234BAED2|nr:NifU N-terminal domain-containing protein [Leptospira sp. GIMC2001]WCL48046.1 NifU N-terminal domain-containing protein [Leptospira sp. GIMC2001]
MLQWIQSFFSKSENIKIVFSDHAIAKIKNHLRGLPENCVLVLSINSDAKGKRLVFSGFEKINPKIKLHKIEGIPIQFLNSSAEILNESGIDWDQSGNIIIYPRVNLHTELTPNPSILKFISNKNLIANDSLYYEAAWDRDSEYKKPHLIDLIFQHKVVESVYLQKKSVQVELKDKISWKQREEKIGNTIIQYLESLPTPISIVQKS